jgi:hypothetical protein
MRTTLAAQLKKSFVMPSLAAGVPQVPRSGLVQFIHDLTSTRLLRCKNGRIFGEKVWFVRLARSNVIDARPFVYTAHIATRARSVSVQQLLRVQVLTVILLHLNFVLLQLTMLQIMLLCVQLLTVILLQQLTRKNHLLTSMILLQEQAVFGVCAASVNTLTNPAIIGI